MRKVFPPLTTNVVHDDDIFDPSIDVVHEGRCDSIVNIYVAERGS